MTACQELAIRDWLARIEETDPATIAEVMDKCRRDADARAYFVGRAAEPATAPDWVSCASCRHSVLSPDTEPVHGWRLCGLDLPDGGAMIRTLLTGTLYGDPSWRERRNCIALKGKSAKTGRDFSRAGAQKKSDLLALLDFDPDQTKAEALKRIG